MKKDIIKIQVGERNWYGYTKLILQESEDKIMNKLKERYKEYPNFSNFFEIHPYIEFGWNWKHSSPSLNTNYSAYNLEEIGRTKWGKIINLFSQAEMEKIEKELEKAREEGRNSNMEYRYITDIELNLAPIYKKLDSLYSYYINYLKEKAQREDISKRLIKEIAYIFEKGVWAKVEKYSWEDGKWWDNIIWMFSLLLEIKDIQITLNMAIFNIEGNIIISRIWKNYYRHTLLDVTNVEKIKKEAKELQVLAKVMEFLKAYVHNLPLKDVVQNIKAR